MYNGIGLVTARGSGTNGYVQRNLSALRKTKEKIPDYEEKGDSAVRPFDPELVEHERRRQAEVRCMELRDLLEEQKLPDAEIERKINDFRAKLLAEKKLTYQKDASGRPMAKDSHEFSMAQEQKNARAKDAFGIKDDFVPGQSIESKNMPKEIKEIPEPEAMTSPQEAIIPTEKSSEKEKAKKRKKHKRSKRSSSSSADSSSDDESHHKSKKRKKEKKKKSKKSRHNRKESSSKRSRKHNRSKPSDSEKETNEVESNSSNNNNNIKSSLVSSSEACCISVVSSESPSESPKSINKTSDDEPETIVEGKYSVSVVDFSGHHKYFPSIPSISSSKLSPVEAIQKACLPLLASVASTGANGNGHSLCTRNSRSESSSSNCSSRSRSRSPTLSKSRSPSQSPGRSKSRTPSDHSYRSFSSRSRSRSSERKRSKSRTRSRSLSKGSRSKSRSRSRSGSRSSRSSHSNASRDSSSSKSRSRSRSVSVKSATPKSNKSRSPSIPRRRGSPSFMERRRITSARKRPIPYKRKDEADWKLSSSASDSE